MDDEQRRNQLSNTCMLQQTDASSKLFGGMVLNMNDPDGTDPDKELLSQLHKSPRVQSSLTDL